MQAFTLPGKKEKQKKILSKFQIMSNSQTNKQKKCYRNKENPGPTLTQLSIQLHQIKSLGKISSYI